MTIDCPMFRDSALEFAIFNLIRQSINSEAKVIIYLLSPTYETVLVLFEHICSIFDLQHRSQLLNDFFELWNKKFQ